MLKIELSGIIVFVQVVEEGNFVKASKKLGLPPVTVGRRISHLETTIGAKLLNRTTRRMELTGVGRSLFEKCQTLANEFESIHQFILKIKGNFDGCLRIAASPLIDIQLLERWLWRFRLIAPSITYQFSIMHRPDPLSADAFDVGFFTHAPSSGPFYSRKLLSVKQYLAASPQYISAYGPIRSLFDLTQKDCLVFDCGASTPVWHFEKSGQRMSQKPKVLLKSRTPGVLVRSSLAHNGVTLLPQHLIEGFINAGELNVVLPKWRPDSVSLFMVYPNRDFQSEPLKLFIKSIFNEMGRDSL